MHKLIGNAANYIEIKTFHSYCFDLLGKVGDLDKSDKIIHRTIEKINSGEVEPNRISKSVLVIDEAQDMDADEYELVNTLINFNEEMCVIAVGDDDQNIYEFRGSSSKYLENFITEKSAHKYELLDNYRSKNNLVAFSNEFVKKIKHRLKNNDINPVQKENGNIIIVRYQSKNLTTPLVEHITNFGLSGSTCVLTQTNDEALQITGSLINKGFPAKLIQTNDGFSIYNLFEIRYFIKNLYFSDDVYTISDEKWKEAKNKLVKKFSSSSKLEHCINIIKDFELSNPKRKYKSDFEVFLRESKLEDFTSSKIDTIIVSTIHKTKGKEFDNIFLMLNNFNLNVESKKRELYVAMTRAKSNLVIHLNNDILNGIKVENLILKTDTNKYEKQDIIILQTTHRDVWLDSFANNYRQNLIKQLQSGDKLFYKNGACYIINKKELFKFSKAFISKIKGQQEKGYLIEKVKINFMVYWYKEENKEEILIALPEIYFKKI